MRIAIAGASGFIGQALVQALRAEHDVIALSRSPAHIDSAQGNFKAVEWRSCDLFSLLQTEQALEGADICIYLVHSMIPSARLSQGSFDDFDLIVADNFARACEKHSIKQIIYLGGILPQTDSPSPHLRSRQEVEDVMRSYSSHVTVLRAAMVIGRQGSSFTIMSKLVKRLPILVCPPWADTPSEPVALTDVIGALKACIDNPEAHDQTYDLTGPDRLTYRQMMEITARLLHLQRRFWNIPYLPPQLSRIWVSLITGAPKSLIAPLITSLRCPMIGRRKFQLTPLQTQFESAAREALEVTAEKPHAFRKTQTSHESDVRSVQRLVLPLGWTAETVAQAYMRWLPRLIPWFLQVKVDSGCAHFSLRGFRKPLLILEHAPKRSRSDRQLFYIKGGILTHPTTNARLEFRETLRGEYVLAAIHNFRPALPWYVYVWSQAVVHLWVMRKFGAYLTHKKKTGSRSLQPPQLEIV